MHTPLQLHELMASRVIDAAGNPNPLAQTNDTKHNKVTLDLTLGLGTANISDETRWSPKGVLSLLDALEAIEWAMILVRMGTEAEVRACISWWRCLVRTKTQKLEHIKAYWLEANWKLCLELRPGADFQQHALQAALQKELPAPMPKMKPQAPTRQHKHEPSHRLRPGQGKQQEMGQDSWQRRQDKKQDARYNQSHKYNSGTGGQPSAQGQLGAGLRGTRQKKASGSTTPTGQPVILLSIFDGIGCAKLALDIVAEQTKCYTLGYLAWGIDQDCIDLTSRTNDVNEVAQQIDH